MAIIFLTGLSGVGKSSVLEFLGKQGYNVVDTDYGFTKEVKNLQSTETIWDEEKIVLLLGEYKDKHLFLSGCYSNQGKFYTYFDHVVLMLADLDVMLERVSKRSQNPYGKKEDEIKEIIENYHTILPLLKKRANVIIDTTNESIANVCEQLKKLV